MKKATRQQIKEQNRNLVLKILFEQPSISRADIARTSHLTRTTVSDIVAVLIEEKLVNEVGTGLSMGGKLPILLSLDADSRHLICLDLTSREFIGAVVNLRGQIREEVSRPIHGFNGEVALQTVCEIIDRLILASGQPLVGIGIAAPGLVSTRDGVVIQAVNMDWQNFALGKLLQKRYQLPVIIINDCQACAVGEQIFGNGNQSVRNLVVIKVGEGIGSGIILDGQIYQGDSGYAGEIGHIVCAAEESIQCRCGNVGCLETVASVQAVLQRARNLVQVTQFNLPVADGGEITLETLEEAFAAGDPVVQQIVFDAAHYLGLVIAHLVGGLNIHKVILTGGMTCFGPAWVNYVQQTAKLHILPQLAQALEVEIGHVKDHVAILGVSALMANNYSLLFRRQQPSLIEE